MQTLESKKSTGNDIVDIRKFLVIDDWLDKGSPCLSDEDCEAAEAINSEMETVCRKYFSMSEQSMRLSAGLRFSI